MRKFFILFFILFSLETSLLSQSIRIANERNIFPDDEGEREDLFYTLFKVAGPQFGSISISPDGKKIAFDYSCLRDACPDTIAVASINGNTDIKIISNKEDESPTWSPDGSKIAFISHRTGTFEIFIMDSDGNNQRQLTYGGGLDPSWSPDGTRIAFVKANSEGGSSIYTIKTDGTGLTQVTSGNFSVDGPCWSPDGTKIAFSTNRGNVDIWNIWIVNADGSGLQQITFFGNDAYAPCWTSDGKWIIFKTSDYVLYPLFKKDKICAINLTNGEIAVLREVKFVEDDPFNPAGLGPASISSDGKKIAFWVAEPIRGGLREGIIVADLEIH